MIKSVVIVLKKKGPVYNELIRHFIDNDKLVFPDERKHAKTLYLLIPDLLNISNKFVRMIGESVFELKEEKTRNSRFCNVLIRNHKLKITETDKDYEFEMSKEITDTKKK